jgi:hypothetical protein
MTDWYGRLMDEDADWGGSPPEPRRSLHAMPSRAEDQHAAGLWTDAWFDALLLKQPHSMIHNKVTHEWPMTQSNQYRSAAE